jgi:AraC-like DNA-binding protein
MGGSELMRALVRRAAAWTSADQLTSEQKRIVAVLLDEIRHAPQEPLHLPMPTDLRALRMANGLIKRPDDGRTLQELADRAGLSERTARRLFALETGMSFAQWRQQARLTLALERLANDEPVAAVAEARLRHPQQFHRDVPARIR